MAVLAEAFSSCLAYHSVSHVSVSPLCTRYSSYPANFGTCLKFSLVTGRQRLSSTADPRWPPPAAEIHTQRARRHKSEASRQVLAQGGRTLLYDDAESYVLMEPGQEEQFVTQEELQTKLKTWLVKWPAKDLPDDLSKFESLDDVVTYLVDSACELDLGGGLGSIQWFQVRMEA